MNRNPRPVDLDYQVTDTQLARTGELESAQERRYDWQLANHSGYDEGFEGVANHVHEMNMLDRQLFEDCPIYGNRTIRPELNLPVKPDWQRKELLSKDIGHGCTLRQADILIESIKCFDPDFNLVNYFIDQIKKACNAGKDVDGVVDTMADMADKLLSGESGEVRELTENSAPDAVFKYICFIDQGDFRPFLSATEVKRLREVTETTKDSRELKDTAVWLVTQKALSWEDGQNYWPLYNENRIRLLPKMARKMVNAFLAATDKWQLFKMAKLSKAMLAGDMVKGKFYPEVSRLPAGDKKLIWKNFRIALEKHHPSFK